MASTCQCAFVGDTVGHTRCFLEPSCVKLVEVCFSDASQWLRIMLLNLLNCDFEEVVSIMAVADMLRFEMVVLGRWSF